MIKYFKISFLGLMILLSGLISCDLDLELLPNSEKVECLSGRTGRIYMDYFINLNNGICECPDSNFYFGPNQLSVSDTILEPVQVCKRKNGLAYLLISDCTCTDVTYNRDSIVVTFDNDRGMLDEEIAKTFFAFMSSDVGMIKPYYLELDDGDEWGSDFIKGNYHVTSRFDRKTIYECSQYGDDVHGEVHGKFNPSDSLSFAWVKWYDMNDQLIDSCKWTLMK